MPLSASQRQTLGWTVVGLLLIGLLAVLGPVLTQTALLMAHETSRDREQ